MRTPELVGTRIPRRRPVLAAPIPTAATPALPRTDPTVRAPVIRVGAADAVAPPRIPPRPVRVRRRSLRGEVDPA